MEADNFHRKIPLYLIHLDRFSLAWQAYKFQRLVGIKLLTSCTTFTSHVVAVFCQQNRYRNMTTNSQQRWIHIGEIDEFARLNCKMKDPLRVEKLLNEIVKGGPNELQVVTDFDFTLTKQKKDDGEPCHSSFGMLEDCQALPESFLSKSKELYNRFRPLEICPNLSQEKKRELMIDWWILSEELYK